MPIDRRSFLTGAASLLAAPFVIRTSGLLMPIKQVMIPQHIWVEEGSNDLKNWVAVGETRVYGHRPVVGIAVSLFKKPHRYHRMVLKTEWQRREDMRIIAPLKTDAIKQMWAEAYKVKAIIL